MNEKDRSTKITDPENNSVQYEYDEYGNGVFDSNMCFGRNVLSRLIL